MELKLADVQRAQQAFQKVMNTDLPVRVAFRLSRMAKVIDDTFKDIEVQRSKLVEKYGAPTDKGFTVKPENVAKFQEEFSELLTKESVTLEVEPIDLSLLEDIKLTPLDMVVLDPFVKE